MGLFDRQQQSLANKPPSIVYEVEKVIRESAGQQIPPGALPEDRVAPSTTEGDVAVTVDGKTQWAAPESLSSYMDLLLADSLLDQKIDDLRDDAEMWDANKVNRGGDTMTGALSVQVSGFYATLGMGTVQIGGIGNAWYWAALGGTGLILGDGTNSPDVFMYRDSANVMTMNDGDSFRVQQDASHVNDVPRLRQIHGVQQSVDDLRDEFEGDVRFLRAPSSPAPSDGCVITSDTSQQGGAKWTKWHKTGLASCPAGTGNFSISGLGFKPRMLLFSVGYVDTLNVIGGNGAVNDDGTQWAIAWTDAGGVRTNHTTSYCLWAMTSAGGNYFLASFVSFDSDGFTVNFSTATSNGRFGWTAFA